LAALLSKLTAFLLLCIALPAAAASTTSTWLGGDGIWTDPAGWSAGVPQNTSTDSFDAVIDGGNPTSSTVTLDSHIDIGTLHIDAGDSLVVTPSGQLMLEGGQIENSGEILASGSSVSLELNAQSTVLSGGGLIQLDGSKIESIWGQSSGLVNLDNRIEGWGAIGQGFTNYGVVEANVAGQVLTLPTLAQVRNQGVLRAVDGGVLTSGLYVTIDNTGGIIEADNASVHFPDAVGVTGGRFIAIGSTLDTYGGFDGTHFEIDPNSSITFGDSLHASLVDVSLTGQIFVNGTSVGGTITNEGSLQGDLFVGGPTTIVNHGHVVLRDQEGFNGVLSLTGGGTVALEASVLSGQIRNIDNQIRGAASVNGLIQNGGLIEAENGVLTIHAGSPTDHTGVFAAAPGGVLEMESTVTGSGSWSADGGQIHVTGNVGTTGDIEVLHGGALKVDTVMTGGNLVVDDTGSLDVKGILRVAGNVDLDGANGGRWNFATGSSFETNGPGGAAIGDWSHWQSLEATGPKLFIQPIGDSGMYLPELVIGPDGRLVLRDLRDNGHHIGDLGEAVYVGTLVFSDSLGLLNLNGISLYYNTLVGSIEQIIDIAVPEPGVAWLMTPALAAILAARRRKLP
jgi:hypothetical protein